MITETSRRAYRQQVLDGKATTQRSRILALFDTYPMALNRRQMCQFTGIPINAVTGRVKAMLDSGLMYVAYYDIDPVTDKRVEYLRPAPREPEQGQLFKEKF